jgi:hypothetical protein
MVVYEIMANIEIAFSFDCLFYTETRNDLHGEGEI